MMRLRKHRRYPLTAPVVFQWPRFDGLSNIGEGVTRDISTSGVFVVSTLHPNVGLLIQLEIQLPQLGQDIPGVRLHGEGRVIRVAGAQEGGGGFAASVHFYPEFNVDPVRSLTSAVTGPS